MRTDQLYLQKKELRASISSLSLLSAEMDDEDEARLKVLEGLLAQTTKEQAPLLLSEEGIHVLKLFHALKEKEEKMGRGIIEKEKEIEEGDEKNTSQVKRRDEEVERFKAVVKEAKTMEELMSLLMGRLNDNI